MPVSRIDPNKPRPIPHSLQTRLVRGMFVGGAALAALGSALRIYLESPSESPKPRLLDVVLEMTYPNGEANLFSWYSTLTLALIAALFLTAGLVSSGGGRARRAHLVIAAAAGYLSADEAARIHEKLNRVVSAFWISSSDDYAWLLVAVPVAAVVGFLLLREARVLHPTLRNRLTVAGAVFLAGAIGLEAVDAGLTQLELGLADYPLLVLHELAVFLEEVLELAGSLIAAWAILCHLRFERTGRGVTLSTRD